MGHSAQEIAEELKRQIQKNDAAMGVSKAKKAKGLIKMSSVEPRDIEWLWHPYIPRGKISLMRGDPGLGKTTICLTLAAIVSNGWAFPTESGFTATEPGNVLYITAEDGLADTLAPRLIIAGANMDKVYSYEELSTDALSFANPRFEELIQESKPKLVIIDPVQGYLGDGIDGHKANEIRPIMRHVGALAEKYNCAIILIEHLNKNMGGRGLYRGLGSIDVTAAARSILFVGFNPDDESEKGIAHIKHNLSKPGKVIGFSISDQAKILWNPNTTLTADIIQGYGRRVGGDKPDNALEEAKDFLREVLKDGRQASKDITITAKQMGISEATLRRARESLGIDVSEREGFGKNIIVYWKLPFDISFGKFEKVSKHEEAKIISIFDRSGQDDDGNVH